MGWIPAYLAWEEEEGNPTSFSAADVEGSGGGRGGGDDDGKGPKGVVGWVLAVLLVGGLLALCVYLVAS